MKTVETFDSEFSRSDDVAVKLFRFLYSKKTSILIEL
jgi:hypothetical protein